MSITIAAGVSAAAATRCPAWCSEHVNDADGSFCAHGHDLPVEVSGAWVSLFQEEDGQPFISPEVEGGKRWDADEAMAFIRALVQAAWILDPDYKIPADLADEIEAHR